jgi:hypothetical protein
MKKQLSALVIGAMLLGWQAGLVKAQNQDQGKTPAVTQTQGVANGTPAVSQSDFSGSDGPGVRLIGDIGFMILTPRWSDNPAYFSGSSPVAKPDLYQQHDFSFGSQFVPQISLGAVSGGGLGFRVGWWGFAMSSTATATQPAGAELSVFGAASPQQIQDLTNYNVFTDPGVPGEKGVAVGRLRMQVWDFEAIQEFDLGQWFLILSGGVRYAHISQDYLAGVFDPSGFLDDGLTSGHNFNGAGPTLALNAQRLLGDSGIYLYGKGRGSLLFGRTKQTTTQFEDTPGVDDSDGSPDTSILATASHTTNAIIPVGELELGVGYRRQMGRAELFIQAGLVAQAWFGAGNLSESSGSADFFINEEHSAINRDGTLGLIGATFKAGINY